MAKLISKRYAAAAGVCLILVLQASAMRRLTIDEKQAKLPGLHQLPFELEKWRVVGEQSMDQSTVEYLKPDEYIMRDYADEQSSSQVNLFVAYFKSLQSKYGPHSPRFCLPSAGWLVSSSKIIHMSIPGESESIPVNQFTMEKGGDRIVVLYWYQNSRATWAEDFYGKVRLLPDLIRYRRSDVSLVRLISPIHESTPDHAIALCTRFAQGLYPLLKDHFASAY
jgi:EpsI family protein